ncbi:LLM class flavin-dependent oxidoreductase [Microbispora corallina]|uniref:Monooxygenase n=1 Tax=Microbispora corallina TaxID=83302 RepID=A0ABQ4FSW9_9ACTN|nr:LLM class flavin-dependent oxidoreductase [Microbispora corallina]GIH37921.1 monooxygenase [Microbispora corallina]
MTLSFGLKTVPAHTTYDEILRVWEEADATPEIEHAWLWDHMIPLFGDPGGPILEGWTLLAALAARTERLRLGLMVTSNRTRPPAVLAKIAATVDVVSRGRLVMGIGVGGTVQPGDTLTPREYDAYGLRLVSPGEGVERLAESCAILRRMWTEDVFDFEGRHYTLRSARCAPKPVQRPGPPIMIGGWGTRTLRVVAEHADIWNIPGPPHNDPAFIAERGRVLDEHCRAIGRDPAEIVRSAQIIVPYDDPAAGRAAVIGAVRAGVTHIALNLRTPFPAGVARWAVREIVEPVLAEAGSGEALTAP